MTDKKKLSRAIELIGYLLPYLEDVYKTCPLDQKWQIRSLIDKAEELICGSDPIPDDEREIES